ncbi:MAG: hypothetical protein ABIH37_02935 [archaeon]
MKKINAIIITTILSISLIIIINQISVISTTSSGSADSSDLRTFGKGVYTDGKEYYDSPGCNGEEPCTKESGENLAKNPKKAFEHQKPMDDEQAGEYNTELLAKKDIKLSGEGKGLGTFPNNDFKTLKVGDENIELDKIPKGSKISIDSSGNNQIRNPEGGLLDIKQGSVNNVKGCAGGSCQVSGGSGGISSGATGSGSGGGSSGGGAGGAGAAAGSGLGTAAGGLFGGIGAGAEQFVRQFGNDMGLISTFSAPFMQAYQSIATNAKGQTNVNQQGIGLSEGGGGLLQGGGVPDVAIAANKPQQDGTLTNTGDAKNIAFVAPNLAAGKTPPGTITNLKFADATIGNDPNNLPKSESEKQTSIPTANALSLPLLKSFLNIFSIIPFIDAEEVLNEVIGSPSGQYVKFIEHDVEFNGRDIEIYALKTFNKLSAGGQDLDFYSGDIQIKFNQQKTYYPRLVKNAPFGVKQIQNKLDQNNEFNLQHYTNRKSQLTDTEERISVTDVTANHPKEKLIISKIRKEMWE